MEPKIAEVRDMIDRSGRDIDLEVDGGVGPKNAAAVVAAGARVLVAGSSLYKHEDGLGAAVDAIRSAGEQALAGDDA